MPSPPLYEGILLNSLAPGWVENYLNGLIKK